MDNYFVAIDFEALGSIPKEHGFTELGAVLWSLGSDKPLETFHVP